MKFIVDTFKWLSNPKNQVYKSIIYVIKRNIFLTPNGRKGLGLSK